MRHSTASCGLLVLPQETDLPVLTHGMTMLFHRWLKHSPRNCKVPGSMPSYAELVLLNLHDLYCSTTQLFKWRSGSLVSTNSSGYSIGLVVCTELIF